MDYSLLYNLSFLFFEHGLGLYVYLYWYASIFHINNSEQKLNILRGFFFALSAYEKIKSQLWELPDKFWGLVDQMWEKISFFLTIYGPYAFFLKWQRLYIWLIFERAIKTGRFRRYKYLFEENDAILIYDILISRSNLKAAYLRIISLVTFKLILRWIYFIFSFLCCYLAYLSKVFFLNNALGCYVYDIFRYIIIYLNVNILSKFTYNVMSRIWLCLDFLKHELIFFAYNFPYTFYFAIIINLLNFIWFNLFSFYNWVVFKYKRNTNQIPFTISRQILLSYRNGEAIKNVGSIFVLNSLLKAVMQAFTLLKFIAFSFFIRLNNNFALKSYFMALNKKSLSFLNCFFYFIGVVFTIILKSISNVFFIFYRSIIFCSWNLLKFVIFSLLILYFISYSFEFCHILSWSKFWLCLLDYKETLVGIFYDSAAIQGLWSACGDSENLISARTHFMSTYEFDLALQKYALFHNMPEGFSGDWTALKKSLSQFISNPNTWEFLFDLDAWVWDRDKLKQNFKRHWLNGFKFPRVPYPYIESLRNYLIDYIKLKVYFNLNPLFYAQNGLQYTIIFYLKIGVAWVYFAALYIKILFVYTMPFSVLAHISDYIYMGVGLKFTYGFAAYLVNFSYLNQFLLIDIGSSSWLIFDTVWIILCNLILEPASEVFVSFWLMRELADEIMGKANLFVNIKGVCDFTLGWFHLNLSELGETFIDKVAGAIRLSRLNRNYHNFSIIDQYGEFVDYNYCEFLDIQEHGEQLWNPDAVPPNLNDKEVIKEMLRQARIYRTGVFDKTISYLDYNMHDSYDDNYMFIDYVKIDYMFINQMCNKHLFGEQLLNWFLMYKEAMCDWYIYKNYEIDLLDALWDIVDDDGNDIESEYAWLFSIDSIEEGENLLLEEEYWVLRPLQESPLYYENFIDWDFWFEEDVKYWINWIETFDEDWLSEEELEELEQGGPDWEPSAEKPGWGFMDDEEEPKWWPAGQNEEYEKKACLWVSGPRNYRQYSDFPNHVASKRNEELHKYNFDMSSGLYGKDNLLYSLSLQILDQFDFDLKFLPKIDLESIIFSEMVGPTYIKLFKYYFCLIYMAACVSFTYLSKNAKKKPYYNFTYLWDAGLKRDFINYKLIDSLYFEHRRLKKAQGSLHQVTPMDFTLNEGAYFIKEKQTLQLKQNVNLLFSNNKGRANLGCFDVWNNELNHLLSLAKSKYKKNHLWLNFGKWYLNVSEIRERAKINELILQNFMLNYFTKMDQKFFNNNGPDWLLNKNYGTLLFNNYKGSTHMVKSTYFWASSFYWVVFIPLMSFFFVFGGKFVTFHQQTVLLFYFSLFAENSDFFYKLNAEYLQHFHNYSSTHGGFFSNEMYKDLGRGSKYAFWGCEPFDYLFNYKNIYTKDNEACLKICGFSFWAQATAMLCLYNAQRLFILIFLLNFFKTIALSKKYQRYKPYALLQHIRNHYVYGLKKKEKMFS